jgi:3-oxoadipate enol-lactonase
MPHPILTGYLPVENGRLFYEIAGGGPALVFIHGFTFDHRMWDDQWDYFRARYTVVRYDWRGHARSSDPEGPWSNFDDLMLLLTHLGIERAHLCGLSAGGGIALDLAVTYPHAVNSLILIDSTVGGFRGWSPEMRDTFSLLPRTARSDGVPAARELWLNSDILAPALERPEIGQRVRRIVGDYQGWHWLNDGEEVVPEPLPYDRLEEITAPALILVGERDAPDFQNIAAVLTDRLRDAQKHVIPGAGHLSSMEAANPVNRLIAAFLEAQAGRL